MDKFQAMRAFVVVNEMGSFKKAADGLGVSPTMVGNYIRHLEEFYGTDLLSRTTRQMQLAEQGRIFLEQCKKFQNLTEETAEIVEQSATSPRGLVRFSAPVTFGSECLTPALVEFSSKYPEITVDLDLDDELIDIASPQYDIALRIEGPSDNTITTRRLKDYEVVTVASPAYVESRGYPKLPADVRNHSCVLFSPPGKPHMSACCDTWRFLGHDGSAHEVFVTGTMKINNARGMTAAALAGQGIALLPLILCENHLRSGALIELLPDFQRQNRPMRIIYRHDRVKLAKVALLANFLFEKLS